MITEISTFFTLATAHLTAGVIAAVVFAILIILFIFFAGNKASEKVILSTITTLKKLGYGALIVQGFYILIDFIKWIILL